MADFGERRVRKRANFGLKKAALEKAAAAKDGKKTSEDIEDAELAVEKGTTWCGWIMKWLLLAIVTPPLLNYAAGRREWDHLRNSTTLYDIGFGQKMHMKCLGKGRVTVLLDSPTGESSGVWAALQRDLAASAATACTWDRAGVGLSDPAPNFNASDPVENALAKQMGMPATAPRMVHDLNRLVTVSNRQNQPFVLVGSELGALNSLLYGIKHPSQVGHIVLFDPVTRVLFQDSEAGTAWSKFWYQFQQPSLLATLVASFLGLNRLGILFGLLEPALLKSGPVLAQADQNESTRLRQNHLMCSVSHLQTAWMEHAKLNESAHGLESALTGAQFTTGCTVITGNYYDELLPASLNRAWSRSAQDVVDRFKCQHIVINGADHNVIYRQPSAVLQPILRAIKQQLKKLKP